MLFYVKLRSKARLAHENMLASKTQVHFLNLTKLLEQISERASDGEIGGTVEVCKFKSGRFVSMKKFLIIIDRHFPRTMIIGFG